MTMVAQMHAEGPDTFINTSYDSYQGSTWMSFFNGRDKMTIYLSHLDRHGRDVLADQLIEIAERLRG